jgi:hypothetical protein
MGMKRMNWIDGWLDVGAMVVDGCCLGDLGLSSVTQV